MRLASYSVRSRASYGAVVGDGVVDLRLRFGPRFPTLVDLLRGHALNQVRAEVHATALRIPVPAGRTCGVQVAAPSVVTSTCPPVAVAFDPTAKQTFAEGHTTPLSAPPCDSGPPSQFVPPSVVVITAPAVPLPMNPVPTA